MVAPTILFLLFSGIVLGVSAETFNLARHLGTKTPYWTNYTPGSYSVPPQCNLRHFQLVARHGSRYPTSGNIDKIVSFLDSVKKHTNILNGTTYSWMLEYNNPYLPQYAGNLINFGMLEHFHLARRFQDRFPDLLNIAYDPKRFLLQTTVVPRASRSGNSFGFGLYGARKGGDLNESYTPFWSYTIPEEEDYTLRFNTNCPAYVEWMDAGKGKEQSDLFGNYFYPTLQKKITNKLGLWNVTASEAKAMYTLCAQDTVFELPSKWCDFFDEEDILQLEYGEDLSQYWTKSYGDVLSYNISCRLLNEVIDIIQANAKGDATAPTVKTRFAHAETIMPLASILGLFKPPADQPMTWNMSKDQQTARIWRSSAISPFAANIAFLLFDCDKNWAVQVLHNEVPVLIPGCSDTMCPLETFTKVFAPYSNCSWDSWCGIAPSPCVDPPNPSYFWQKLSIGEFVGLLGGVGAGVLLLSLIGFLVYVNQSKSSYHRVPLMETADSWTS